MDKLIFPTCNSKLTSQIQERIIFIDKSLPILHLPNKTLNEKSKNFILLCFHGNGEDLQGFSDLLISLTNGLELDAFAMEYPGYGLYKGTPSSKQILNDALLFFDFVNLEKKIPSENIIIFGRSIGTGPATYVAAHRNPAALILMSPFFSIKELILRFFWKMKCLFTCCFKERFNNGEQIINVKCPIFLVHGEKDFVIPISQSKKLIGKNNKISYRFSKSMTHNEYNIKEDIIQPIKAFFKTQSSFEF